MITSAPASTGVGSSAWHALEPQAALATLRSEQDDGLTATEAAKRLARHGPNSLQHAAGPGVLKLLWRQMASPIVYLLLGSAVAAVALGKVLDGVVVLGAIVVNALIGFVQDYRAGKAIEALSRMVPQEAQVVRDGRTQSVRSTDLVPGDVVLLASGDKVPADVRLVTVKNLHVEEAALTGESLPSSKAIASVAAETSIGDRKSMAFAGTSVTSGTARALVVATGEATEIGRISHLLRDATVLQSPLTRTLASLGKWLTVALLAVSAVLFVVGLLRGYAVADALLVAITLAVASIPEGLPAIITIALAVGAKRMAARSAVIRHLPSVETLGSTTVICSDKTGTLTRNEMTVQGLYTPENTYALSGVGYSPEGAFSSSAGLLAEAPADVRALVEAGASCSDASVHSDGDTWKINGDPTEGALIVAAMKAGVDVEALRRTWSRLDVIPFESAHQFMATLHSTPAADARVVFMKGAPEVIVRRCDLAAETREKVLCHVASMTSGAMRVLAVAQKSVGAAKASLSPVDVEGGFTLMGLAGMIDPPRPEAIEAVKLCKAAGITVKMITGDHVGTAEAIGKQLGLIDEHGRGMTGADLAPLDPAGMRRAAAATNVFARVAPEHKLGLVKALQDEGHVVAMTGDGVNDAPALKQANVGIAMGITGSAVSKEAADVVLADDNFASIASAVEEGRRIYDNLVKSLAFVLPTNLGLGFVLIAAVAFFPVLTIAGELVPLMPMLPRQILWVNLVAAIALSLPLSFEAKEPDAMKRPPRPPNTPILGRFVIVRTVLVGLLMAASAVGLFLWEYWTDVSRQGHALALREAQTMAVTTVIFLQCFYLLACRSLRGSIVGRGFFSNPAVFVGIGGLLLLQAGFIYLPFLQAVFGTAPLTLEAVALSALVASFVLPLVSIEKVLRKRSSKRAPAGPLDARAAAGG